MIRTAGFCVFALLAFAANSLLCRMALRDTPIDPATFSSLRLSAGALMLFVLVQLTRRRAAASLRSGASPPAYTADATPTSAPLAPPRTDWIAIIALTVYALAFSFAYVALPAGTGALLLFGAVQLVMIVVALLMGERMSAMGAAGWLITVAGVIVLVAPGVTAPPLAQALLMLGAGVAWGAYTLRGRGSRQPLKDTARNFMWAWPIAAAVNIVLWRHAVIDERGAVLAALSGSIASGAGYAAWYTALPKISAIAAANLQLSVPIITALGGVALFGESVTPRLIVAALLVLGGIAISTRRPVRRVN